MRSIEQLIRRTIDQPLCFYFTKPPVALKGIFFRAD